MFIKLTKFDNRPVWLNAAFIVTVEPQRNGTGSVVVPIGDGLDYDVRESPEDVLRMLDGCPAPTVVPVPVSDCLTKTPADVSPEPERSEPERPEPERPASEPPKNEPVEAEPPKAVEPEAKPVKKTVRAKKAVAPKKAAKAKKPTLELSDEDVARLAKLSPKSVAKLKNTLASQFRVADVSETVVALEAKKILSLDGNHVNWNVK